MILIIDPNFRPMTSKYNLTNTTHPAPNHSHSTLKWCFWRSSTEVQQAGVLDVQNGISNPPFTIGNVQPPQKKRRNVIYTIPKNDGPWNFVTPAENVMLDFLIHSISVYSPLENQKWQWKNQPFEDVISYKNSGWLPASHVDHIFGWPKNSRLLQLSWQCQASVGNSKSLARKAAWASASWLDNQKWSTEDGRVDGCKCRVICNPGKMALEMGTCGL